MNAIEKARFYVVEKKKKKYRPAPVTVYSADGSVIEIIKDFKKKKKRESFKKYDAKISLPIGYENDAPLTKKEEQELREINKRFGERYENFRARVLKRDNHQCVLCGSKIRLQVHHIKRWADDKGKRFFVTNGVTLCFNCHDAGHNHNKERFPKELTKRLKQIVNLNCKETPQGVSRRNNRCH